MNCDYLQLAITFWLPGQISLMGQPERSVGGRVTKGNVYLDGHPVCDRGWSLEDATVACRSNVFFQTYLVLTFNLHRMLGYGHATPERGSPYGLASATDKFEYTEFSCNGNERNLLDCPLK